MTNDRDIHDGHSEPRHDADRDLLITRAIDGRASAIDWAAMEALAGRDPSFWRELALAQRDQRVLERLVGVASNVADSVDLPAVPEFGSIGHLSHDREVRRRSGLRIWGGWVAAAILFVAILSGKLNTQLPAQGQNSIDAGLIPANWSSDQYIDQALQKGQKDGKVMGEYGDPYVLATEPSKDGKGYTVVYIRPILVKRQIQGMYQPTFVYDESGQVRDIKTRPLTTRGGGY